MTESSLPLAKVLTVSDGVIHGTREDLSGRALVEHLGANGFEVVDHRVTADGLAAPWRAGSFDAVLLDAPCSGLGALRRRADARWRITAADIAQLAELQTGLLSSAAALVATGGRLVYSVCTITAAESIQHPTPAGFEVDTERPEVGTWRRFEQGWRVLPQDADTDGMVMIRYRRVP